MVKARARDHSATLGTINRHWLAGLVMAENWLLAGYWLVIWLAKTGSRRRVARSGVRKTFGSDWLALVG
jgi:hypothetical protein